MKKKKPPTQQRDLLPRMLNISIVEQDYLATPQKIMGSVLDSKTRQPISGARIRIPEDRKEAVTDSLGRFSLIADSRDTISLEISAIGRDKLKLSLDKNTYLQNIQIVLTDVDYFIDQNPPDFSALLQGPLGGYYVYNNETIPEKIKRVASKWYRAVFKKK